MNTSLTKVLPSLAIYIGSGLLLLSAIFQWLPIDLTEAFGFATGAVCVWLVTRGNIWNWPLGLLNNVFFAVLFWKARLFADFGLQIVYFALGAYGWWNWLHGGKDHNQLPATRTSRKEWILAGSFLVLGTWGLRELLIVVNGAAPFWDSTTTILCLIAQYLLCQKRFENWLFWIAADLIYVPLYLSRGLPLISILYAIFLCLCFIGVWKWRKELTTL